jgi:prevent-host-death family protein
MKESITVNIHEAKTHFSKLIKKVLEGEKIIISKNGIPLVKLIPLKKHKKERTPGLSRDLAVFAGHPGSPTARDHEEMEK